MSQEQSIETRLALIEARLSRIESKLALPKVIAAESAIAKATPAIKAENPPPLHSTSTEESRNSSITTLLGWSGAAALVMAAVYLIRLALDSGWLTPERQIGLAIAGGFTLIGTGLALRHANRQYASLLPAGGIVTLFLAVYGAHMFYGLISPQMATAGVMIVAALSLWLCRVFASELYALFAVAGSYAAPFLIENVLVDVTDLAIYFSAWSVIFSIYAVWTGRRLVYLLALYFALIGFDVIQRDTMHEEWIAALVFQTLQFAIFSVAAAAFSIRRNEPMTREVAIAHLPALLIFYFLQYALLAAHLPGYAPWIALATAGVVALLYFISQNLMRQPLPGGHFLLSAYVALVLFHAGYLESVPDEWTPWVAFVLVPAVAWFSVARTSGQGLGWPVWLGVGIIAIVNYMRIVSDVGTSEIPGGDALPILYALECYAAYWFVQRRHTLQNLYIPLLYAGHICAMAAAVHLLDDRLSTSLAWGMLATGCLGFAIHRRDRILGQSSLLIFAASAGKVLIYDLHQSAPLMRIGILLVLGLSLYAGGWLYQRMLSSREET
ncbi:hypothetical protein A7976_07545 [Methylobacillus sp. MM3]|uniref:DUF2339 domain-containing protein n=1 Tax=Methylobacillus sp. MM3 TaxID=1848039 RepID=UPI0007DF3DD4|nr:DUF2339 domain-containing protein [Methylobacillus sp. MM3]OAJ71269.1 hypothetical protein A7976_07545 [Methylobacillus sp. MM3]